MRDQSGYSRRASPKRNVKPLASTETVWSMNNATAVSDVHPLEGPGRERDLVSETASGIPAGYRSSESGDVVPKGMNPTGSNANVGLEGFGSMFRVGGFTASCAGFAGMPRARGPGWREDAYEAVGGLAAFPDGWDGPGSAAASHEAVRVARVMIREWPNDLPHPELDLLPDGSLVFEIFDDRGFAVASIESRADGSVAYVVANGTEILASAQETDGSRVGIAGVLGTIRDRVA